MAVGTSAGYMRLERSAGSTAVAAGSAVAASPQSEAIRAVQTALDRRDREAYRPARKGSSTSEGGSAR
jgi:hypothetical protein